VTPGQVHESTQAIELLGVSEAENILADKGYDSDAIRDYIKQIGANAVIPPNKSRSEAIKYDTHVYKERHLVENFFQFIKRFRRIGTRYETLKETFVGMISIACILQWLIF